MADLLITIGADASNYNSTMSGAAQTAQTTASKMTDAMEDASKSTDNLGKSALSTSMRFQTMRSGLAAVRDGSLAFAVGGQRADMMLMAMGHHITTLVSETGSLQGAFSSMASSLMGVGGVILALTVAFEIYEKSVKGAKDSTKDYADTLDSVHQAQLKGEQDGRSEITRLQILYHATQDHTLSLQQRNLAYDELNKQYPAFFTNADREKTLLGENKAAYDALTQAVFAAAMAKAAEAKIDENANKMLENHFKGQGIKDEMTANSKAGGYDKMKPGQAMTSEESIAYAGFLVKQQRLQDSYNDVLKDSNDLLKQNNELYKMAYSGEVNSNFKQSPGDTDDTKNKTLLQQMEEQLQKLNDQEDNLIAKGHVPDPWNTTALERQIAGLETAIARIKELNSEMTKGVNNGKTPGSRLEGLDITADQKASGFGTDSKTLAEMQQYGKTLQQINEEKAAGVAASKMFQGELKTEAKGLKELTDIMGRGLMDAFQQALSGQQSFLSAFGSFILALIEKMVAATITAAILAVVLSYTTFGANDAAGATFSSNFSSIFGNLSGLSSIATSGGSGGGSPGHYASGGIFTKETMGTFGEAGPEAIVTPKHLQEFAGVTGNQQSVTIEPFMIGPNMWYRQQVRGQKSTNRTT